MPAKSKAQQRLFGLVHAYQKGKVPASKVSPQIKKIAKSISPEEARKYAKTSHKDLREILKTILSSPSYTEQSIREIVESNTPSQVKGQFIDVFTAQMLATVMDNLNEDNKSKLLNQSLDQMVALSYKILTH